MQAFHGKPGSLGASERQRGRAHQSCEPGVGLSDSAAVGLFGRGRGVTRQALAGVLALGVFAS